MSPPVAQPLPLTNGISPKYGVTCVSILRRIDSVLGSATVGADNLATGVQLAPHDERRRSQRVILRVSVKLHLAIDGKPDTIAAFTVNVNDHGALLISPENFQPNDRFVLEHAHTRERMGCRVTRKAQPGPGGFQVGVEFDRAAPGFWHIAFPPTNWKAEEG